ncbi:ATP synthase F1 subunit epsilon [Nocardioides sp.]|uniref:ATP synthase F1 subunit epsilon n=1 Tax=Nocardioides sp. TaxID=35761 RepID=UPI00356AC414
MAEKSFELEIVTPERSVYKGRAKSLVLPAADGLMGVLPNHAPIVAVLDIGPVKVEEEGGRVITLMVSDGFFEMADNKARILADVGEESGKIDIERAREAERRARERLSQRHKATDDDVDFARAERALQRALWRLSVAGKPTKIG